MNEENRWGFTLFNMVLLVACAAYIIYGHFGNPDFLGKHTSDILVAGGVVGFLLLAIDAGCRKTGWGKGWLWW